MKVFSKGKTWHGHKSLYHRIIADNPAHCNAKGDYRKISDVRINGEGLYVKIQVIVFFNLCYVFGAILFAYLS